MPNVYDIFNGVLFKTTMKQGMKMMKTSKMAIHTVIGGVVVGGAVESLGAEEGH